MEESLLFLMIERMSVATTLAFILSQTDLFHRIAYSLVNGADRLKLTAIFGIIGIVGTYAGIPVGDALANSRVIGVMVAGLIGGPTMGLGAGIIAGGHRYLLGGFTAFSCALANVCEGLLAGCVKKLCYPNVPVPCFVALAVGILGEMMQMGIILLTASPLQLAADLVGEIAMPMIVANSIGIAVFMLIFKTTLEVQNQAGARQSQKVLQIAAKTLPYFRRGINAESAQAAADIIYTYGGYHAVAVTDTEKVLAFVGAEAQHHLAKERTLTQITKQALETRKICVAKNKRDIGCKYAACSLQSGIVAPLTYGGNLIGTFKLYYTTDDILSTTDLVFAKGLAELFSTQLELAEIDRRAKQAAEAELKALQAQINPHFLFNTLNTIISLIRTKPATARNLLVKLSELFRFTLHKTGREITLAEELEQIRAYLTIEQARYGDKVVFCEAIDLNPAIYRISSLTIQPLIENALQHGLKPKASGGTVILSIQDKGRKLEIKVVDDGVGFDMEKLHPLEMQLDGHIGIRNVHERLRSLYGKEYGLTIDSAPGRGTTITIEIPKLILMDGDISVNSYHC